MPSPKFAFLSALCCLTAIASASAETATNDWLTDYQEALDIAREQQKPILLHFFATWCGPCRSMDRQVLHTADVKQVLGAEVIGVKIDSDKNPAIIKKFGVGSLPSDIVIDPDGNVLYRGSGFKSKNNYISMISSSAKKFDPIGMEMVQQNEEPAMPEEEKVLLGLEGFSPVVLLQDRQWIEGNPQFVSEYQGIEYHLQSEEEKQAFDSDPERFAPQLLECDPVEMYFSDKAVRGSTQYGAYFDGKLFLFVSHDNRETFKKSPLKFTDTRHVFDVNDIVVRR